MHYSDLKRIEKLKKILEYIAYGSLAFDAGVAIVTLASVHFYAKELAILLKYLNLGLTAIILVSAILFLVLLYLSHYEKIIEKFAELSLKSKINKSQSNKRKNNTR
ncbi:MAG: hypothetical protein ACP5RT_03200 [Candidatus Micrarchaeia archaeon]